MSNIPFDDFDLAAFEVLDFGGVPRLTVPATVNVVDPVAIAYEVFHRRFDLSNPAQTIAALEAVLPTKPDGTIAATPTTLIMTARSGAAALDARWSAAASALETLSRHAATSLDRIRPLRSAPAANDCGWQPVVNGIRGAIADLERAFAGGEPLVPAVEDAADTLIAELKRLEKTGALELSKACSADEEQIVRDYTQMYVDAEHLKYQWDLAKKKPDSTFGAKARTLRHQLAVVVATLNRLHNEVSAVSWTAARPLANGATPAQLWQWMRDYSAVTAPRLLKDGGKETLTRIAERFKQFRQYLVELRDRDADLCAPEFKNDKVQPRLNELICAADRIITAAS